ncbi:MOSC domain-containing protein [uncultured Tateyamaria sp.]|uniref:MOSC domain-containing protein n=1 Tax=uncultured Tateyamaria sp. TaxID=455651 RepID=UPI002639EB3C|nr:MOSC domain-containing protein [uncultured Tateyamaria sp.]
MSDLHVMMARSAQAGRVTWIGVRGARRVDVIPVERVAVTFEGLEGDHARPGKRAVTLVQAEHLAAIGAYLGREPVLPAQLRRNLVVAGLNLAALKGREVALGSAVLRLSVICAPCSRMEETFGHGGYSAVRGHGGWCAEVVQPGQVALGDAVRPVD